MKITHYLYNAFLVEEGDKKVAIDPGQYFYFFNFRSLIPKEEWPTVSHIVITHGDPDHHWQSDRLAEASGALHRYPSTDHAPLRAAIGAVHGLDPDRIICGVGSDEVLQFVTQCFAGPGDEVIYAHPSFPIYGLLARSHFDTGVSVPLDGDDRHDLQAMLDAVVDFMPSRRALCTRVPIMSSASHPGTLNTGRLKAFSQG